MSRRQRTQEEIERWQQLRTTIINALEAQNLSRAKASKRANLPATAVSDILSGRSKNPEKPTRAALSNVLKVDLMGHDYAPAFNDPLAHLLKTVDDARRAYKLFPNQRALLAALRTIEDVARSRAEQLEKAQAADCPSLAPS